MPSRDAAEPRDAMVPVTFEVSAQAFAELTRMLDEPPRVLESLRVLAQRPSIFVELPAAD